MGTDTHIHLDTSTESLYQEIKHLISEELYCEIVANYKTQLLKIKTSKSNVFFSCGSISKKSFRQLILKISY